MDAINQQTTRSTRITLETMSGLEKSIHGGLQGNVKLDQPMSGKDSSTLSSPVDLLHFLGNRSEPQFALLDAARDPRVLSLLQGSEEKYQSLYEGAQGEELAAFAPYLVQIPAESSLLETMVQEGWGKSWGVYLTCGLPFEKVRRHLRKFLLVQTEDGRQLYFRFYDPRVLRAIVPTFAHDEAARFFGPIASFLMEDQDQRVLLLFECGDEGIAQREIRLSP